MEKEIEYHLLQEAYYGKLPEFEEIEELLETVMEKVKKEPKTCNPNKYPEMKKIEKLFSKVFGFKKSLIYWEAVTKEDAYTVSMNTLVIFANKGKDCIKKTNRGFYDENHSSVLTVYLGIGLILLSKMSARELLACILHEIGHNFDLSGYHLIGYYMNNILYFGLPWMATANKRTFGKINKEKMKYYDNIKKESDKLFNDDKDRNKANQKYLKFMKTCEQSSAKFSLLSLVLNLISAPFVLLFSPITQITTLAGKKGELFADSFATAYGYGTELVSALDRLSNIKKYYNPKSKAMNFLQDLGNFQTEVYISFNDVHGTNIERCIECKKNLQHDLKTNDFSPELKEELEKEIDKIDESMKSLKRLDKNEKITITKLWRKVNATVFRGSPLILQKLFKTNKV